MNRMPLDEVLLTHPQAPPLALGAWALYASNSAVIEQSKEQVQALVQKMHAIAARSQAALGAVSDIHTHTIIAANTSITQTAALRALRRTGVASPLIDAFEQTQRARYFTQLEQIAQAGVDAVVAELFRDE